MSTQQQDTQAKAEQHTRHNMMLKNIMHEAKASFLVSSAQPAAHVPEWIHFGFLCQATPSPWAAREAPRSCLDFAQCTVSRPWLLLPLQQPERDCMGLCLQRLICPSTSESRRPPAILGCCQEPRPASDSLRIREIHVLSPYTCIYTQGTEGGTCWRAGCHPELGQKTHTLKSPCPRRGKALQYFSVSPPKLLITQFCLNKNWD